MFCAMYGGIVLQLTCACGHRADLTEVDLGEDAGAFDAFHRLRCKACGRRGRPASVIRAWRNGMEHQPYRGSFGR